MNIQMGRIVKRFPRVESGAAAVEDGPIAGLVSVTG